MVMNDSAARPRSSITMSNSSPPAQKATDASPGVPSAEETGEDPPVCFSLLFPTWFARASAN